MHLLSCLVLSFVLLPQAFAQALPDGGALTLPASAVPIRPPSPEAAPGVKVASDTCAVQGLPWGGRDFSWMPGNAGPAESPLQAGPFTGEVRLDSSYHYSLHRPQDHTLSGSSEVFRHGELQLTHVGLGGSLDYKNVQARVLTQFGLYSTGTPRNDVSPSRGAWQLADAYRYLSEAYAGYHFDVLRGINVQAGIFMSYVGLWSYYNFDNWTYQPSFVSSNTPWFFNGVRVQIQVNDKLKIEPWLVNGWQAYGNFNSAPGLGLQVAYRPNSRVAMVGNQYVGWDTLAVPERRRMHTDNSVMVKYFSRPQGPIRRAAVSVTVDAGCESGGGVTCRSQYFLGFMAYHRAWFANDTMALTLGGGAIQNPGRYLVLLPPINGATASSGTASFTAAPKDPYRAWDTQVTFDYMPKPYLTFRVEFTHRAADVPYFAGPGGMTPKGGAQGAPGSQVQGFAPDLRRDENRFTAALLARM